MTIAMTMGVPSRLIEPEKIGELERRLGERLNTVLDSTEDFSLFLTLSNRLEFAFVGISQGKIRQHLRGIATDMLVEQAENWKSSLIRTETKLAQKIDQDGPSSRLSQELESAKESRMRLDTFLLAQ